MIAPVPKEVASVEAALMDAAGLKIPGKRKRNAGRATMKARRAGLPREFPAGERWKRRLPKVCW
jgi:hypothetical protein